MVSPGAYDLISWKGSNKRCTCGGWRDWVYNLLDSLTEHRYRLFMKPENDKIESITPLDRIVDLNRYCLDKPVSAEYQLLVESMGQSLERDQICILPQFILEDCRNSVVDNVLSLQDKGFPAHSLRNVYLERQKTENLPENHSRNIMANGRYRMLGAHVLPRSSPLKTLYYSAQFQNLVARITRSTKLYSSDDPYQPVNVICYGNGDRSAWHFDSTSAFTLTLMLQASQGGGEFEMVPNIRSGDDPNESALSRMLLGDRTGVKNFQRQEGALVIFKGCNSAHRVTEVSGQRKRLMCIMVYEDQPGVLGDPVVNETVYGVPPAI